MRAFRKHSASCKFEARARRGQRRRTCIPDSLRGLVFYANAIRRRTRSRAITVPKPKSMPLMMMAVSMVAAEPRARIDRRNVLLASRDYSSGGIWSPPENAGPTEDKESGSPSHVRRRRCDSPQRTHNCLAVFEMLCGGE